MSQSLQILWPTLQGVFKRGSCQRFLELGRVGWPYIYLHGPIIGCWLPWKVAKSKGEVPFLCWVNFRRELTAKGFLLTTLPATWMISPLLLEGFLGVGGTSQYLLYSCNNINTSHSTILNKALDAHEKYYIISFMLNS